MLISISCVELIKWTVYAIDINMILHTVFTKFADIRLQEYIDDKYSVKTQEYLVCESLPALKQQGDFISRRVIGLAHNDLAKTGIQPISPVYGLPKTRLLFLYAWMNNSGSILKSSYWFGFTFAFHFRHR